MSNGGKTIDRTPDAKALATRGFVSRVATAVRYAIRGVTPETWMSPNQPVQPQVEGTRGRLVDYRTGYNLNFTPRAEELSGFRELRALADNCDLVRLAIETRKDQMVKLPWKISHAEADKDVSDDPRVQTLTKLFRSPDGVHTWQGWLRSLIEEVMVTDATTILPCRTRGGDILGFELMDGSLIKVLVDANGRTPAAPSPAYQQVLKGIPTANYSVDELVYAPRNPRVWKFYGYSPVEQIRMTINIAIRRSITQLSYFTEGNIPEAFAALPADWTGDQIAFFQEYWDTVMEGDQAQKHKVRFVPGGTKVENAKESPLKDEFDEWIARLVCYTFSLPPTAFIKQQNRSTSETQQDAALDEGLAPLMSWVKDIIDLLINKFFGFPDLQFSWAEEDALDPTAQSTILTNYVKIAVMTINEAREKLGLDPVKGGDTPMIFTASGAMTLKDALEPPPPAPLPGVLAPTPNATEQAAQAGGDKPAAKPPGKVPPDKAQKHDHGDLHKTDTSPLTAPMTAMKSSLAQALDVVRDEAVKKAKRLGKAAPANTDDRGNYGRDAEMEAFWDGFADSLDTSGLSLAWDDVSDTLQAVAADGGRQEVARIVTDDPSVNAAARHAGFDMFGHQDPNAIAWAKDRAAALISKDGTGGELDDATRNMVRQTISKALEEGATDDQLADALNNAYAFSEQRAELIARTEVKNALGNGGLAGAKAVGMKSKRWLLSNDENVCPQCTANAAQKWIPIDKPYVSGAMAPGQHPHCQCDQAYRRQTAED